MSWLSSVRRILATTSIPQRLVLLSACAYGGVFTGLLAYGRPGMGLGQAFYLPVVLAAAATSPFAGGLAGAVALFLYELAIHDRQGLMWTDFAQGSALTRLACFVAVGVAVGFLARRGRLMLAQSLHVLEELVEIAYEQTQLLPGGADRGAE